MRKDKEDIEFRAANLEVYKNLNQILRKTKHPVHDDIEVFSSLSPVQQMAVVAYRFAVDLAASSKVSIEKWVAVINGNGEMLIDKEHGIAKAVIDLADILLTNPQAKVKRDGKALAVGEFLVVRMLDVDLVFKA